MATGGRIVRANAVDLCAETFGDPADPAILLVGNSMLSKNRVRLPSAGSRP